MNTTDSGSIPGCCDKWSQIASMQEASWESCIRTAGYVVWVPMPTWLQSTGLAPLRGLLASAGTEPEEFSLHGDGSHALIKVPTVEWDRYWDGREHRMPPSDA